MFDLVSKMRPLHYNVAKTLMMQLTERIFYLQHEKLFFEVDENITAEC